MKWFRLFLLLVLVSGCGKTYTVTGKVTRGGKPIEWQSDSRLLLVHFAPVDGDKNQGPFTAKTDEETGTYTIKVPRGPYMVAVHILDPSPKVDVLNLAYDLANSPLRYEVKGDAEHIIDLPLEAPRGPKGPFRNKE